MGHAAAKRERKILKKAIRAGSMGHEAQVVLDKLEKETRTLSTELNNLVFEYRLLQEQLKESVLKYQQQREEIHAKESKIIIPTKL